jgi:predicted ATPase
LVERAVSGAPSELVKSVRDNAGGVPLYAVESLRMLAGRGVMVAEGGAEHYRLVGTVSDLAVPPSIHALIAARLDALGSDERHLLLDAAVLGQRFTTPGAAAVAGVTENAVSALLDGLVAKRFLTISTDLRSPERGQYAFSHRQLQRVAQGTMSKADRKARHLRASEWLVRQEPDPELAGVFAGHLLAAADADSHAPDAQAIRRRALGTLLAAARRAASIGSLREAEAMFERSAEIDPKSSRARRITSRRHAAPSTTATRPPRRSTTRPRASCTSGMAACARPSPCAPASCTPTAGRGRPPS